MGGGGAAAYSRLGAYSNKCGTVYIRQYIIMKEKENKDRPTLWRIILICYTLHENDKKDGSLF